MKLICEDILFSYPEADMPLFSDLNLKISGPGFFSLFGVSGCGKSTLARIIAGHLRPVGGRVILKDISSVLFSYNTERLPGWMTVYDHLHRVTTPEKQELLKTLIAEFRVADFIRHKFSRLSMGQKNRVNLLRYLTQEFDMLIADEVLANVDEPSRNHILSVLKGLFPQKVLIYISHNADEVALFSKKVFVLPQAKERPQTSVTCIDGFDAETPDGVSKGDLRDKIIQILRASTFR